MPSSALLQWRGAGQAHLAAIRVLANQQHAGSDELEQAQFAYIVQTVAEFQEYCRELHRLVVVELMAQTATQTSDLEIQLRKALQSTYLTTGNPTAHNINQDFQRLGLLELNKLAAQEDAAATVWQASLKVLLNFRNAIAHGDRQKVALLLSSFPGTDLLSLGVGWAQDLDQLVSIYDRVVSFWLSAFLQLPSPW